MSLDDVLSRFASMKRMDHRVFAREKPNGVREFDIMTLDEAWAETVGGSPSHLYEVLAGPCEVYLDIEWKCDNKPESEESIVMDVVASAKSKLMQLYDVEVASSMATASGFTPDGMYKCSWHVNFKTPGVMWASAKHVGDFVKRNLSSYSCVDCVPYNAPKQNWRCVGSSKCSDPTRVLQPKSKNNFLKCIVQQDFSGARIVGCREPVPQTVDLPDVARKIVNQFENVRNDACHVSSLNERYLVLPFLAQVCPIAKRKHRSNHQYAVVDLKCMRWKHCCHNSVCQQKIQIWQPMPDFDLCKTLLPPCAPVCVPKKVARLPDDTTPSITARARGPPPVRVFTKEIRYVRCADGLYHLPSTI